MSIEKNPGSDLRCDERTDANAFGVSPGWTHCTHLLSMERTVTPFICFVCCWCGRTFIESFTDIPEDHGPFIMTRKL